MVKIAIGLFLLKNRGQAWHKRALTPFTAFSGKTIGVPAIPSDISATVAAITASLHKIMAAGTVYFIILLFLLDFVLNNPDEDAFA